MTLFEILSFFITPLLALLEPYVQQLTQWLTSSALHRKIIKFFIGLIVLLLLIGVSLVAYLSFYWVYIPQRGHVGQVHLQYERPTAPGLIVNGPSAEIDFSRGGRYGQFLRADQAYDISVKLHVPTSERNVEIGNFMVMVTLLRADGKIIMTSSRPTILTYQSVPLKLMKTAWKAVPLVLDWSKEDQMLRVPLVENYIEDASNPVARAYVEISSPELQVYKSSIHIDAHFHGLRYFMYYYKLSTALVFMSVFIFWEIIFSVVTWQVLAGWFGTDAEALAIAHQLHPQPGQQRTMPGQPTQQQQLRAPTTFAAGPSTAPGAQLPSVGPSPRQPQLQEHGQGQQYSNESDSEYEEHDLLGNSSLGRTTGLAFDHDEMEDDDDEQDQELGDRVSRGQSSTVRDEAVVPERPLTPSQHRYVEAGTTGVTSSSTRSGREPERLQQRTTTTTMTTKTVPQDQLGELDDGASTSGSAMTTGSSRRVGRRSLHMTTSSEFQPPPPPPPSVLSEQSSEFQMSQRGAGTRRTAVESEYTEEEDEYLEGVEEDEEDDGDVTFGEDDFATLSDRSPGGPRSAVRSRHTTESRSTRLGRHESTGRSSGRA
ncbi:putative adipose-regulatory protein-domain-containing protein [Gamsiella multidivaricata]|uniref:putative adipose-regulatory protein-domain-containing protein n=1 Tax=Gamsiella multidivaricata TaxID=101098 RepID=UPI0022208886|nr:putative adipose-regulatory protein-domain-containing protein [Gamsiella multidivaricata]KAI7827081.1 putative adipose-regulatory protein-domain-containing protein [Gamsiella multidivaricata]